MPWRFQCRWCNSIPLGGKEPILALIEPVGPCPVCGGLYRHKRISVPEDDEEGGVAVSLDEGEPVSAADLYKVVGDAQRTKTGLVGVDHLFNGGLPRFGGAVLFTAPAGIGKSTLLQVLFRAAAEEDVKSLYVSGEQTLPELGQQFAWLGPPSRKCAKHMMLAHDTDRDEIIYKLEKSRAKLAAVDSLHAVENVTDSDGMPLSAGHPNAVAQVALDLKRVAAECEMTIFAVGHMKEDGTIAGGTRVRHVLDATLVLRAGGASERNPKRILEFEGKNRFGPRGRRALFMMTENGFEDRGPLPDEEDDEEEEDE